MARSQKRKPGSSSAGQSKKSQSPAFLGAVGLPAWNAHVIKNETGNVKPILHNAIIALEEDPVFRDAIRYDQFRTQTMLCRPVPWDRHVREPRPWEDQDDRMVTAWLQENQVVIGLLVGASAVQAVAEQHRFHPVTEYLDSIHWDGHPRIDEWLINYVGAEDSEYIRAIGARWLISGVARVMDPGCQADCVLVLEGPQGIKKTTTFAVLGGAYYTNDVAALGTTAAQEQILGKWIVELDELEAVTRASDIAAVRAFVSRRVDNFRLPYGHRSHRHPRQCIFGGTTNRETWLRDETGGRRWWPVQCGTIDIDALREDRDQLWAEARDRHILGEPHWLETPELVALATEAQEQRFETDPWEELVLERKWDIPYLIDRGASTNDIFMILNVPIERRDGASAARVSKILRHIGWERRKVTLNGINQWRSFPK